MVILDPWAVNPSKLSMSGSLGFLFFYELLTGTLKLPIIGTDDSHAQANTLLRIVPSMAGGNDSVLTHVLRILARDRDLATKAPKYDPSSNPTNIPSFLGTVQAFLSRESQNSRARQVKRYRAGDWLNKEDREDHPRNELSPETVQIDRGTTHRPLDRSAVTPAPRDFSRQRIELRPIDESLSSRIAGGVQSLASSPLAPLGLSAIVEHTALGRTSGVKIPWKSLNGHPAASSNIAHGLLERLSTDLESFNVEYVKESALNLTGMHGSQINVKDQLKRVRKLLGDIQLLQQTDLAFVKTAQRHCCDLANGRVGADSRTRVTQCLAQRSGIDLQLEFEHVVALLCSSDGPAHILSITLGVEPKSVQQILSLAMIVMMTTNRVSHAARCEELTRSLLGLLRELREMERREGPSARDRKSVV